MDFMAAAVSTSPAVELSTTAAIIAAAAQKPVFDRSAARFIGALRC